MKGVLRVPCLTKKYHDLIREEKMPEFESLEYVFNNYYNNQDNIYESDKETHHFSKKEKQSQIEKFLIQRNSIKKSDRFDTQAS